MNPLVSVIALCFNHEKYVKEALESVINQSYQNIELIIVDDYSKDQSPSIINNFVADKSDIKSILHKQNLGNCKSFNEALRLAKGKYIVDFATDDVMMPDMLKLLVSFFESCPEDTGIVFANAIYINEKGKFLKTHSRKTDKIASGDVYKDVIERFFIAPPSVIMRKTMLERLGGYDESLAYEDFDLWVRAARDFKFYYLPEVVIKKRVHSESLSNSFYKKDSELQESTFRVCQKALWLNTSPEENLALAKRISYEMRVAYFTGKYFLVKKNFYLISTLGKPTGLDRLIKLLASLKLNLFPIYNYFLFLRKANA